MLRQPSLNVRFRVVAGFGDQPALDRSPDDRLERRARLELEVVAAVEQFRVAGVAQLEPVVGVVEGEALRDALDGVDQALAGLGDLPQIVLLDLDRGVAKHGEGLGHAGDLVTIAGGGSGARRLPPAIASMLSESAVRRAIRLRST